ncbi:uncharacterized protein C8R40DRAFT_134651 [Lentinula edodes]|uniref:uncharacterized protein n=1 Tax=Lentinula edodes TaxID=5353 RepID=UPI001E8D6D2B|nr:uncharacterized protein C8R40DRAFT_134651 [Lentinula edodes]KAH7876420.1 hypothetical protein C8R40DRAFT_134651 [Lentinula edodes]
MSSSLVTGHRHFPSATSIPNTVGERESSKRDDYYIPEKVPVVGAQPQTLTSRKLHPAFDTMRWACALSHIGLIVLLALFVFRNPDKADSSIISFRNPNFKIVDDDDADLGQTLQASVKLGFGWIITGWTIVLTLTTQKLALRRQLNLYSSLTAKHDANDAWMGLGSSLMTFLSLKWRQLEFRESLNSLFLPLLYLAGIASLHSVGTGMFGLVATPLDENFNFLSQGLPDFTNTAGNVLSGSSALLTMLSLNALDFPGLASGGVGVIYDIPMNVSFFPPSIRQVEVMATHFNVTCGSLAGSVQNVTGSGPAFFFEPGFGLESTFVPEFDNNFPNTISQHSLAIRPAPWGPAFVDTSINADLASWPSSILVFTTVPVTDSSNTTIKPVSISPPMTYFPQNQTTLSTTSEVNVLACNLTVDALPDKVIIDPVSNALLSPIDQANKTAAKLSPFPTALRTTPFDELNSPEDALIAFWSLLPIASVSPLVFQLSNLCTTENSAETCGTLYESEQFVMESLNLFPDLLLPPTSDASANIDLADLENALSRMTAIEIWAEGQGNNLKFANRISSSEGISTSKTFIQNSNTVEFPEQVLVFAINRIQLFGVFAIAIVLLLLVIPSLLDNNGLKIDSIGILQMIWLANDHPELQQSISALDDPSTEDLRNEGMKVKRNFHRHNAEGLPQQPC